MSLQSSRPELDPELDAVHKALSSRRDINSKEEELRLMRQALNFTVESAIRGREDVLLHEERDIPGPTGSMRASIFRSQKHSSQNIKDTPAVLHMHGGGHIAGNRFMGLGSILDWVEAFGAVCVSAEYRLAPEHPQPAQLEDSYAALTWMSENAKELGFNPDKLVVCGGSAGGNLAAGVTLLSRDRSGPKICGQVLVYPWLDDGADSSSMLQFGDIAPWTRSKNIDACNYALGKNREHATIYTVPSRAKDLSGLPPTFIDVGEADVFRDQDIDYASTLWKCGVSTELHVWPGVWHGFDAFVPDAPISHRARATRLDWLRKLLN